MCLDTKIDWKNTFNTHPSICWQQGVDTLTSNEVLGRKKHWCLSSSSKMFHMPTTWVSPSLLNMVTFQKLGNVKCPCWRKNYPQNNPYTITNGQPKNIDIDLRLWPPTLSISCYTYIYCFKNPWLLNILSNIYHSYFTS